MWACLPPGLESLSGRICACYAIVGDLILIGALHSGRCHEIQPHRCCQLLWELMLE
jgi:hypothetical protein